MKKIPMYERLAPEYSMNLNKISDVLISTNAFSNVAKNYYQAVTVAMIGEMFRKFQME